MPRYSPQYYSPPRRGYGSPPRRGYGGGGGGGRPRSPPRRGYGGERGGRHKEDQNHGSLLVRNIPLSCRAEELRVPFERFGVVRDVYLPKNYYTGEPRGFAFVQFVDAQDAAEAQYHMNGQIFAGREISVVLAAETRKRPEDMRRRTRVRGPSGYYEDRRPGQYDFVSTIYQSVVPDLDPVLLAILQGPEVDIDQGPTLLLLRGEVTTLLPHHKGGTTLDHQEIILHKDEMLIKLVGLIPQAMIGVTNSMEQGGLPLEGLRLPRMIMMEEEDAIGPHLHNQDLHLDLGQDLLTCHHHPGIRETSEAGMVIAHS